MFLKINIKCRKGLWLPHYHNSRENGKYCRYQNGSCRGILCRPAVISPFGACQIDGSFNCGGDKLTRANKCVCKKYYRKLSSCNLKKVRHQQKRIHIYHTDKMYSHIALVFKCVKYSAESIAEAPYEPAHQILSSLWSI